MASAADPGALYHMSEARTRWISPENPTGAPGAGGHTNRGAKGRAFIDVSPGETAVLADITGAGIIHRMWLSGTIPRNEEQRRLVRLQMYWDGAAKPAVDCPAGDFFGAGLGLPMASREHSLSPGPRRTPPAGHARAGLEQGQNQQGTMRPIVSLAIR